MTSILRTYYTWKIYKSEDISYNMVIMGFWTWAEIAIGITVSSLPVLPKFFKHFGPRIRWSLLSRYRFGSKSESSSLPGDPTAKTKTKTKVAGVLAKRTEGMGTCELWKNSNSIKTHATGDYITLDDFERQPTVPSRTFITDEITGSKESGTATIRDDLERGRGKGF